MAAKNPHNTYLDANAGISTSFSAIAAMKGAFECTNPSNTVCRSGKAAMARYQADERVIIRSLTRHPSDWAFVLTSGGTEGIATALLNAEGRILCTDGNHPSVVECQRRFSLPIDFCDASPLGVRSTERDYAALFVTLVVSISGEVVDSAEIATAFRTHHSGSLVIVDATQAIGKMKLTAEETGGDILIFSSHKFGGPKGCGGLLLRAGLTGGWKPLIPGTQQGGLRGGTYNTLGMAGTAAALVDALHGLSEKRRATAESIEEIAAAIEKKQLPLVEIASPRSNVGNTLLVSVPICSRLIAKEMAKLGYDIGIGTACQTKVRTPTSDETAFQLRISLPMGATTAAAPFADALSVAYHRVLNRLTKKRKKYLDDCE